MSIQDLIDQFEIEGKFQIKTFKNYGCDEVVLAEGEEFRYDRYDVSEDILEMEITYMYADSDGVLNIEVK